MSPVKLVRTYRCYCVCGRRHSTSNRYTRVERCIQCLISDNQKALRKAIWNMKKNKKNDHVFFWLLYVVRAKTKLSNINLYAIYA